MWFDKQKTDIAYDSNEKLLHLCGLWMWNEVDFHYLFFAGRIYVICVC
jgi:hypothetical protein